MQQAISGDRRDVDLGAPVEVDVDLGRAARLGRD
jgi:hypothetical protein